MRASVLCRRTHLGEPGRLKEGAEAPHGEDREQAVQPAELHRASQVWPVMACTVPRDSRVLCVVVVGDGEASRQ